MSAENAHAIRLPSTLMELDTRSSIASTLLWRAPPADLVLPAAEIHIFAFALDLPASLVGNLERLLSHDEVARAERFKLVRDRRRYIVGRARMRTILGRYLNREATHLQFCYGSHGKPALSGGSGGDRLRFNMSRSHGLGIMAIQLDSDLGIDLEHIRPFPDALPIAERLFAPEEYQALRSLPGAQLDAAFFSYWTRKEAIVKSIGLGLSHPMDAFALARHPGASEERVVITGAHGAATRWSLTVPPPSEGYVAALATAGALRPLRCWFWSDPPMHHH